jgi:hypothetical protein
MDGRRAAAATLGVRPGATKKEIRRAFRARARLAHPDTVGSNEAFIALRQAVDLLLPTAPDERHDPITPPCHWMRTPVSAPGPRLDATDVRRRPLGPVSSNRSPMTPKQDGQGLSFDEHLARALASQR